MQRTTANANIFTAEPHYSFTRAKVFGFVAGLLVFLLSLSTGIFLTFLHYYYCIVLCILASTCWLYFLYGAVKRSQVCAALTMMFFALGCVTVFVVLIALFGDLMTDPERGPLCKLFGGDLCSSKSNLAIVCVFSIALIIDFICIELLRRFLNQLSRLNQQARSARLRAAVSLQTCIDNARREFGEENLEQSCFYILDPSRQTIWPSQLPDYASIAGTSAPGAMLSPPTYLEATTSGRADEADDAPPDYNSAIKGTVRDNTE